MYNLSDICSLCLVPHKNIESILSQDTDGTVIKEKLRPFLLELVDFKPNIPKYICNDCLLNLNYIYKIRLRWLDNTSKLKKYVQKEDSLEHGNENNCEIDVKENDMQQKCLQDQVVIKSEFHKDADIIKEESQTYSSKGIKIEVEDATPNFLEVYVKQEPQTPYEMFMEYNEEKHINENVNTSISNNIPEELLFEKSEHIIVEPRLGTNLKEEDYVSEPDPFKDNNSDDEYLTTNASSSQAGDSDLDAIERLTSVSCKIVESEETTHVTEYATENILTSAVQEESKNKTKTGKASSDKNTSKRRSHTGDKPYKCDICDKTFARPCHLTEHKRVHTGEKPYKCDMCDKAFNCNSILTRHKRTHNGEKPYKCDVCKKSFTQSYNLALHKLTHTDIKAYKCDMCDKAYSYSHALMYHKRKHTGEKPYKCDVCDQAFSFSSALLHHKRKHTGEKPYKCDVCNEEFSYSHALVHHKRKHTGEKPYKCDICDETFSYSNALTYHTRKHTGEKPYVCDVCYKAFDRPDNLKRHKLIHTPHADLSSFMDPT